MYIGGFSNTQGACPGCGQDVHRSHEWNTGAARDVYACIRCGTFQYGTTPAVPSMFLGEEGPVDLVQLIGHDNLVA